MRRIFAFLLALFLLPAISCKHGSQAVELPLRGTVLSIQPQKQQITLAHEEIKGFMPAMTMPYSIDRSVSLEQLHVGDTIQATLLAEKDSRGELHHARLARINITAQHSSAPPVPAYNTPTAGQSVPNFRLINQDGASIHTKQFQGKTLLITWIYTRCPLADFCPRMSRNFAEINAALKADKTLYATTHLLSLSFDPAYDKPAVLKSYGEAYLGDYTNSKFDHWDFAAPVAEDLVAMERFFQLGVMPGEGTSLDHSLSTLLVSPDGKIVAWYPDNDWTPAQVLSDIRRIRPANR